MDTETDPGGTNQNVVSLRRHVVAYPVEGSEVGDDEPAAADAGDPGLGTRFPVVLVATPGAVIEGEPQNEFATASIAEILTAEQGRKPLRGPDLLRRANVVDGGQVTVESGPEKIDERTGLMLGEEATTETFLGVVTGEDDRTGVVVHATRVFHDGDVVFAYGIQYVPDVEDAREFMRSHEERFGPDREEYERLFERTKEAVTRDDPSLDDPVSTSAAISDLKLVQVVSDTFVGHEETDTPENSPSIADPELVAGDQTAPMFDLDAERPETVPDKIALRFYLGLYDRATTFARPFRTERFEMDFEDMRQLSRGFPVEYILARNIADADIDDVPVFEMDTDIEMVTLSARLRSGYLVDSVSIRQGSDYTVQSVDPLRVGFITVTDPADGANYGDSSGTAQWYERTVNSAVAYMTRVFPGGLAAYRWDNSIQGHARKNHSPARKALVKDHLSARSSLADMIRTQKWKPGTGFVDDPSLPPNGVVYSHQMSDAEAESIILEHGFDVWVLIVPRGYYAYHNESVLGMNPSAANTAVSAREERDSRTRKNEGKVVVHEIGHFVGVDYADPPDHPLAHRDDDGQDTTVGGTPVDTDHARYPRSTDVDGGGEDKPGVLSSGYDLVDGTFRIPWDFRVENGRFEIADLPYQIPSRADNPLVSYMSTTDVDLWADSRVQSTLIDHPVYSRSPQSPTTSIVAIGTAAEDGTILYDSVKLVDGQFYETDAAERDDGQVVEVELRDVAGEVLAETEVSTVERMFDARDVTDVVTVSLPFPARAVEFVTTLGGTETHVNPIVTPVECAFDRIPDSKLVVQETDERDTHREQVATIFDRIRDDMADSQYGDAATVMREDVRPLIADCVGDEDGRFANQPTRSIMLNLIDRMGDRLETIATQSE